MPEVWFWKSDQIKVFRLNATGEYEEVNRSSFFPNLDPGLLLQYIGHPDQYDAVVEFVLSKNNILQLTVTYKQVTNVSIMGLSRTTFNQQCPKNKLTPLRLWGSNFQKLLYPLQISWCIFQHWEMSCVTNHHKFHFVTQCSSLTPHLG